MDNLFHYYMVLTFFAARLHSQCQQGLYVIDKVTHKHCFVLFNYQEVHPLASLPQLILLYETEHIYQATTKVLLSSDYSFASPCERKSNL